MIRVTDGSFNKKGYIPSVQGISVGSTKDELINIFGEPDRDPYDDTYGCPGTGEIGLFGYRNIGFWVCSNNKIYLIDIPSPY
jgi:hypothetical protein